MKEKSRTSFKSIIFSQDLVQKSRCFAVIFVVIIIGVIIFFSDDIKKYFGKKEQFCVSNLDLTERQLKCFRLAVEGLSFKKMAEQLFVSESVVKKEMTAIYQTLHINGYTEFLLFVATHEIID